MMRKGFPVVFVNKILDVLTERKHMKIIALEIQKSAKECYAFDFVVNNVEVILVTRDL